MQRRESVLLDRRCLYRDDPGRCATKPCAPAFTLRSGRIIVSRAGRGSVEERRAGRDRDAGGVRVRGHGDRAAADVDFRGVRIVRDARTGRVRRPAADSLPGVRGARMRRRHFRHARDALLAKPVARRRGDGGRRLRHPLFGRVQRLLLGGPHSRDAEGGGRLLACVRDAARGRDKATVNAALVLLWASQHLDNLWQLETHLGERANAAREAPVHGGPVRKLRDLLS